MLKFLLVLIPSIFIMACSIPSQNNIRIYNLFIGTDGKSFESNSLAIASGTDIDGDIFIYLNGNPISYYGGYGATLQINQWLVPQKNSITIKGLSTKDLFIKVAAFDHKRDNFEVIFKKHIKSGKINTSDYFHTDIDFKLPLFNSLIPNKRDQVEIEIIEKIKEIKNKIDKKQKDQIVHQLLVGASLWQPMAYKVNWSNNKKMFEDMVIDQFFNSDRNIFDFDDREIKVVYGKNCVYVYSGVTKESAPEAYFFKINNNGKTEYVPAVKFFKYRDKWEIWQ